MRNKIKAIPTKYNGQIFRSKMESRFAKWCDDRKQQWVYEPEGLTDGKIMYLPDFYLPESKMIVEIKPLFFIKETYKLEMLFNSEEFDNFGLAVIEMMPNCNVINTRIQNTTLQKMAILVGHGRKSQKIKELKTLNFVSSAMLSMSMRETLFFSCNACGYSYAMR